MHTDDAFDGGYYMLRTGIMPTSPFYDHTARESDFITDRTVRVLNILQATPWMINTFILDVIRECWNAGISHLEDFPLPEDKPFPPRYPRDVWEDMTAEQQAKARLKFTEVRRENSQMQGRRESLLRKLAVADRYREETIWYPWFMDWRTRMYPQGQDLNPQSDNVGKALLMFARGTPLGEKGFKWLKVLAATQFGHDKLSFDEREDWTEENFPNILDSAEEPFDGNRLWMDAENPFGFLATCREISEAFSLSDVREHVSHLPVNMDGSCNGLQLLSLAGRDTVGAIATNCAAGPRQDLYTEVAEAVKGLIQPDANAGHEAAMAWLPKMDRKVVKRAVMTTPYGVTQRGIRMQLIEDGMANGLGIPPATAAEYLKDKIIRAMEAVCEKPKQIMNYFQETSLALADLGYPMRWTTPFGNTVEQCYSRLRTTTVATLSGRYSLWLPHPSGGVDGKKQSLGAAPNVVHSWDASLMQMVTEELHKHGVQDFAMIHDSFGVPATHVDLMNKTIREKAVAIFEKDVLSDWTADVQRNAPAAHLPSQPEKGDFDVRRVLESEFFFS